MRVIRLGNGQRGKHGAGWAAVMRRRLRARDGLAALGAHRAARAVWGRRLLLGELGLYLGGYLVYLFSRGLFYGDTRAVGGADGVGTLQKRIGFFCS